jgi:RNA polymerase sigma-70 factor (ECF subfamily)
MARERIEIGGLTKANAAAHAEVVARGGTVVHAAHAISFADFYEVEHGGLFGALYLVTRNRHEAEDVMQDAFLKVLQRWNTIQGLENPTGYLYRTAMNTLSSRKRRAVVAARALLRHPHRRQDDFDAVDARTDVGRALDLLTERQRAALVLVDLLGFPTDEAGASLEITPSTVRVLLARARQTLRGSIGAEHV